MRVLITNDDGVSAPQLPGLVKWVQTWTREVTVFAPKVEQSGKSHSFEIHRPFEAKEVSLCPGVTAWSVDSSPADCVRMAVLGMGLSFDLVISGVNRGLNLGADIMYSGTVAAVSEGVNLGMKGIALSTPPSNYDCATQELDRLFRFVQERRLLSLHSAYNINIPANPLGIRITHQGGPYFSDDFVPAGDSLYRPVGKPIWVDSLDDSLDTDATLHGYISITPLTIDRTDWRAYHSLQTE